MAGPAPTFASVWSQAGKYVSLWDSLDKYGNANTPNLLDKYSDVQTALDGEYVARLVGSLERHRGAVAAPLSRTELQGVYRPFLQEMMNAIGAPEVASGNDAEMLRRIRRYMVDNNQYLKTRGMTLGTPTVVGSATGSGVIRRLTVDRDGNTLECVGPEVKTFKVINDQASGAKENAERFEVRGEAAWRDGLQWTGSGLVTSLTTSNIKTSNLLRNASFETTGVSTDDTAPTSLTNWTVTGSLSNLKARSAAAYVFRGYPGEPSTLWGLEFEASETITQTLSSASNTVRFLPGVPYFYRLAVKRFASATGTVTIHLGSQSVAVDLSTLTNDTWHMLYLPLDENCYYDNFKQADITAKVVVATLATGTVGIDDFVLCPMTNLDGTYYVADGGATAWLKEDKYSVTDTDGGTRSEHPYWLWRAYGPDGWLPNVADATEVTAAGGRTLTFADADPDTITASSGSFVTDGYVAGMTLTVAGTSNNNGTYTIATVAATVLTLASGDTLTAEGPLSATATLNATAPIANPA